MTSTRPGRLAVFVELVKRSARAWSSDRAPRLAAALAYYAVFSLAPLLLIAVALAGFVFGEQAARGEIAERIGSTVGESAADVIEELLVNASRPGSGIIATVVGGGLLFFSASGVFLQLQAALNKIFDAPEDQRRGLAAPIRKRIIGFLAVVGAGVVLTAVLALSSAVSWVAALLPSSTAPIRVLVQVIGPISALVLGAGVFALAFQYLTVVRVPWKAARRGGALTALLFAAGAVGVGAYVASGSLGSAYGQAGSLVVLLAFLFYQGQIFFFGAEFTKVYADRLRTGAARAGPEPAPARAGTSAGPDAGPAGWAVLAAFVAGWLIGWRGRRR